MTLIVLPAVDVADGAAVRLVRGAAGTETAYGDPLEAALAWQRDGAEWLHLVDLDRCAAVVDEAADALVVDGIRTGRRELRYDLRAGEFTGR